VHNAQFRIQKYCLSLGIDIFPPDHNIFMLRKGALLPITKNLLIGGIEYVYSYCPVDGLVLHAIRLLPDYRSLKHFDVIIGGDSGQGSFKCYMKSVL